MKIEIDVTKYNYLIEKVGSLYRCYCSEVNVEEFGNDQKEALKSCREAVYAELQKRIPVPSYLGINRHNNGG